jgi:hypothetical protein
MTTAEWSNGPGLTQSLCRLCGKPLMCECCGGAHPGNSNDTHYECVCREQYLADLYECQEIPR